MSGVLVEAVNSNDFTTREELFKQIDKLENKGDDITHQIYLELGKNFITPFDREDIHSLASAIDDIADYIHGTANRMSLYLVVEVSDYMKQLSELILKTSIELQGAVKQLRDLRNVR